ncbi:SapC protein [Saccharobesus litoralis]|uniref:SapC protein n=1 Tax=Saccharobesus litoralis TaxID=2172099 RepID=A0A2S0VNP8_9ALTE|nr:SapC family protein [Saccharobesus litoralis]AWB65847.1 SapC protein [Saccharobesus litoralis]
MANYTVVEPQVHKNTSIALGYSAEFGDNIHFAPVIADELRRLVTEYPVGFLKDPQTGQFNLQALLGFEVGENLFLQDQQWLASYIPLHFQRQPFMFGVVGEQETTPADENLVVAINMDSPRVQTSNGHNAQALFDEQDKPTAFMQRINSMLSQLMPGIRRTDTFVQALLDLELIERVQFEIRLKQGGNKKFDGFYSINEDKLAELQGDILQSFHSKGYLQACHLIIASLSNLQKLVNLKDAASEN